MNKKDINFQQARNFGQILNGTFQFFKSEFKPLFKALLFYAGPFILIQTIVSVYFQSYVYSVDSYIYDPYNYDPFNIFGEFLNYYLLLLIFSVLGYTMLMSVTYSYICLYAEKGKGNFTSQDIWYKASHNFLKILGANIVIGILVGIGVIMCIVPGIYLFTSLCLVYMIMIWEKKSFGEAFSRSFSLTTVQFWWTLLIIVVIFTITSMIGMVFSIPNMILTFTTTFMNASEVSESLKTTTMIVSAFTNFINSFLNVIPMIALSFHYFNLIEIKESPTLLKKIDEINEDTEQE